MAQKESRAKGRKINRGKRKAEGRGTPLSRFVRNLITGEEYFRQTNQNVKH